MSMNGEDPLYPFLRDQVAERPDSMIAVVPVTNADGERGVFWGSFSMMYQGGDLTQRVAADCPKRVRVLAVTIACMKTRDVAKERGLVPR